MFFVHLNVSIMKEQQVQFFQFAFTNGLPLRGNSNPLFAYVVSTRSYSRPRKANQAIKPTPVSKAASSISKVLVCTGEVIFCAGLPVPSL